MKKIFKEKHQLNQEVISIEISDISILEELIEKRKNDLEKITNILDDFMKVYSTTDKMVEDVDVYLLNMDITNITGYTFNESFNGDKWCTLNSESISIDILKNVNGTPITYFINSIWYSNKHTDLKTDDFALHLHEVLKHNDIVSSLDLKREVISLVKTTCIYDLIDVNIDTLEENYNDGLSGVYKVYIELTYKGNQKTRLLQVEIHKGNIKTIVT